MSRIKFQSAIQNWSLHQSKANPQREFCEVELYSGHSAQLFEHPVLMEQLWSYAKFLDLPQAMKLTEQLNLFKDFRVPLNCNYRVVESTEGCKYPQINLESFHE